MSPDEARQVLARWKPGIDVTADPEMSSALELASRDSDLGAWFERHRAFQTGAAAALRGIPVPADLHDRILAERKVVRPSFRILRLVVLAGAAALVVAALLVWSPPRPDDSADFATFRSRMVRSVLREYRMDVQTNDLPAIREFLARNRAPADFHFTPALADLTPVGGGLLSWQGRPVSMVCLDGRDLGMLFVFIAPSDGFRGEIPRELHLERVNRLSTASWTADGHTYLVAAEAPPERLRQLL